MNISMLFKCPKSIIVSQIKFYSKEVTPKALRSLKAKSTRNNVQYYVDSCRVRAVAGNGGDGCVSFLSAWCKEQAGPNGGDGGHGGHVIFQVTHSKKSLNHCHTVMQAKHGEKGGNKDCDGKNGQHLVVEVPLGTIIRDGSGTVVGDLQEEGTMFVAARGGAGGRGNKFFLTDTEQAPMVAEYGALGETNHYFLEVRSMAHLGLIGFPNAGKSTLLRAVTRARPTVAPYPFTTLRPHIGIQFLQHAERCKGLIFLLDGTDSPLSQYESLSYELLKYNKNLANKSRCVVVNKIDLEEAKKSYKEVKKEMKGLEVIGISAKTGLNLAELLRVFRNIYDSGDK